MIMKTAIFSVATFLLLLSSCGNSQMDSTDLELVSENLEVANTNNHDKVHGYLIEIKEFQMENPDFFKSTGGSAWNDKLNNTIDKIESMGTEEKKTQEFLDQQISKLEDSTPDLNKINASLTGFLTAINSTIKTDGETKVILDDIKSILDGSKYKLDGSKMQNTLALKSMKLSVSQAYLKASSLIKSMVSLGSPERNGVVVY